MADNNPFVDRTETYLASPEKVKINKNKTTIILTGNTSEKTTSTKKRVSSTSWQITKTTEITDEVKTGQKVSTMDFEIGSSGCVSPTSSPGRRSFVSSTEFTTGSGKTDGAVGLSDDGSDPADEYVFIENEDVNFIDRVETTEIRKEQESIAPEPKKSYFAYLLDQDNSSNPASQNGDQAASEGEDLVHLSSAELEEKKKDDATLYERITYTPGLAIRSYAVEEIQQKRSSEGSMEDAENNNMQGHDGGQTETRDRVASSTGEAPLTPAQGYRISQIIAMQETDLWEQERLRKEREEYAIIDSLSMDDMMKMLGEHDRMKFESQEVNEEVFPIIPGLASDAKYSEISQRTSSTEKIDTKFSEMSQGGKASAHREAPKTKRSDASPKERTTAANSNSSEMSQKVMNPADSGQSTEVKYSEVSQTVTGPTERKHISDAVYSEVSSKVQQIRTDNLSLQQVTAEADVTDSPSVTKVVDNRQTETNALSLDQSSMGHAQELKTQMKSFSDAEQSISMSTTSVTSSATVVGGVSTITAQKQTETSQSPSREESISPPIEVERKFNITAETENKIKKLGGKLMKERSFSDIYFDNCDYCLTLSDCWLRKRENKWELKVASEGMSIKDRVSQYKEVTNEKEIVSYLKSKLKIANKCSKVKDIIKSAVMSEFATILTTRKSYRLADCTIDLDLTDHGFQVGEIEVVAPSSSRIPAAIKTIDDVARRLGLDLNKKVPGKMTDSQEWKNPHLYKLLINKCVLMSALSDDETDKSGIT
ncbi:uncharacterized protein LOC124113041 isoform X1 [Haliotis rufescens]|uniref:uncharacterized protein LOC124113041 isoform X1 n=1 Tax=Haliotis rufescens TaxID=6454 RepID=UPI00201F288B|nr:uncharacterized protein LOC124113041 isoform X1 [Haliotis rufescens]XP_048254752.1 uncharacterized protein LOC124113041 isoform X1 [Haliotis rufescens]XP_048254753.1 uncharacterized protein LOC124113041 isoform X1 [Haliotis rufescens]XP_048254754.1 uncharacterized protein LOC124113041 isoform X1 [Haliotis rufescens]